MKVAQYFEMEASGASKISKSTVDGNQWKSLRNLTDIGLELARQRGLTQGICVEQTSPPGQRNQPKPSFQVYCLDKKSIWDAFS